MDQACSWMGPGGGETLVDGIALGVGSRRSRASGSGYSRGIPGVTQALGGRAYLGLAMRRNRRLSKDYEALPETEEAFIYIGMIRLMLRRLANAS
jgi:hypothetical protein